MTGNLETIWIKRGTRAPMDPVTTATLIADRGLKGNANQGGKRQVTILAREHWDAITGDLPANPIMRRANLLISGVDLRESRGKILRVGNTRLRILGETRPCERMDEACDGLRAALSVPWGGGAFGEVLDGGEITIGDAVDWDCPG